MTASGLTQAAIRAEIDALTAKGHGLAAGEPRVIGVRATPVPDLAQTFAHVVAGQPVDVRVVPCVSALAVWEALADHRDDEWLVVVTDRPEDDLGTGILAHLIGHRLRLPDPWLGVRAAFGATGVDRSLTHLTDPRAVAHGLLAIVGSHRSWPAAPAGLLTLDHVAAAIARHSLGFGDTPIDGLGVVRWTAQRSLTSDVATLRRRGGDALTNLVLRWLATRAGAAEPFVAAMLGEATPHSIVPWGLAVQVLLEARTSDAEGAEAWGRLRAAAPEALRRSGVADALGGMAVTVTGDLLETPATWGTALSALEAADRLLESVQARRFAERSLLLPSGLTARLRTLAQALDADDGVDAAWSGVRTHALIHHADRAHLPPAYAPAEAAVRLCRWLALKDRSEVATLAAGARRQVREDAWVDSAIHDAAGGVQEPTLATALASVVVRARARRRDHDVAFADALARSCDSLDGAQGALGGEGDDVWPLEHVVPQLVAPLAKEHPALLLVLDGMTARVALEVVEDLRDTRRGWVEAVWASQNARAAAVAVLPTLTEHSRTSLLCGRIRSGNQSTERAVHPELLQSLGAGPAKIFHKAELDQTADGHLLAHAVREAVTDTAGTRLVTCVLNFIDDALDRSDPERIDWRLSTIKHLEPLLDLAASVGRPVVLVSDHGHVLERRAGRSALPSGATATSARSRTADSPAGDGEVAVRGGRVALGEAVLAVDETLRYTGLKAGYHGGGSPAEVCVPVVLLWPGAIPEGGPSEAGVQRPDWWDHPHVLPPDPGDEDPPQPPTAAPPLFDLPTTPPAPTSGVGRPVVDSKVWESQTRVAGRVTLQPDRCAELLDRLAQAPGTRLPLASVARVLGVSEGRVGGAVSQLQKLTNVDGYAAVRTDSGMVVLDLPLLAEQFGVKL